MAADINIKHPPIAFLSGSSAPTGEAPVFEPLAVPTRTPDPLPSTDPVFAAIDRHKRADAAWKDVWRGRDCNDRSDLASVEQSAAYDGLVNIVPTTVAGLKIWSQYIDLIADSNGDQEFALRALSQIADACEDLLRAVPLNPIGTGYDADLIAWGKELDELTPDKACALSECERLEAVRNSTMPTVPPGLLSDPEKRFSSDVEFFIDYQGENRFYTAKAIERLRNNPRTNVVFDSVADVYKLVPNDEAQVRAAIVIAAFDEWQERCQAHDVECGYDAAVKHHDALSAQVRALLLKIRGAVPLTLRGLAIQAEAVLLLADSQEDVKPADVVERLFQFAEAAEIGDGSSAEFARLDENRSISILSDEVLDRRALEAYATWLFYERRLLLVEMHGREKALLIENCTVENAGGDFHFPRQGHWQDVAKPSTRAKSWLDMLGMDWRSDRPIDQSGQRHLSVIGKVA